VASLAGCRVAIGSEVDQKTEFSAATINAMTGGDTIRVSEKFGKSFDLKPTWTPLLSMNHKPRLPYEENDGIWRRLMVLPFEHVVAEADRDRRVKEALRDPKRGGPVVLRWLLDGCQRWMQEGLTTPSWVANAVHVYRASMDASGLFIANDLEFIPGTETTAADLMERFKEMTDGHGRWGSRITKLMEEHGAVRDKGMIDGKKVAIWKNVRLTK